VLDILDLSSGPGRGTDLFIKVFPYFGSLLNSVCDTVSNIWIYILAKCLEHFQELIVEEGSVHTRTVCMYN